MVNGIHWLHADVDPQDDPHDAIDPVKWGLLQCVLEASRKWHELKAEQEEAAVPPPRARAAVRRVGMRRRRPVRTSPPTTRRGPRPGGSPGRREADKTES